MRGGHCDSHGSELIAEADDEDGISGACDVLQLIVLQ